TSSLKFRSVDLLDDLLLDHCVFEELAGILPDIFIGDALKLERALAVGWFFVLAPAARSFCGGLRRRFSRRALDLLFFRSGYFLSRLNRFPAAATLWPLIRLRCLRL